MSRSLVATILDKQSESNKPPRASFWTLLTAGTLGTAIGDWVAEELHMGTGFGTLLLGAIFAVVLALGKRSHWSTKAAYWTAIIAVQAAGTTAGDWLAFREDPGLSDGLNLGLPLSTALTCALCIASIASCKDSPNSNLSVTLNL